MRDRDPNEMARSVSEGIARRAFADGVRAENATTVLGLARSARRQQAARMLGSEG
jgi:hypothetical protein